MVMILFVAVVVLRVVLVGTIRRVVNADVEGGPLDEVPLRPRLRENAHL